MKPREERFFGSGNFALGDGHRRGWKIQCKSCPNISVVSVPKPLPPDVVIKKFRQRGWIVGTKPQEDICQECHNRSSHPTDMSPNKASTSQRSEQFQQKYDNAALQTKINELTDKLRRYEETAGQLKALVIRGQDECKQLTRKHQDLVRNLHELLINDCVDIALQKIEDEYPNWPWERRLPKIKGSAPAPKQQPASDAGFDQWLNELEKTRSAERNGHDNR